MMVFVLFANAILAQVKLSGKVTTPDGGVAAGVTVTIKGTKVGTVTDNNGFYTINSSSLKPGNYTVVFSGVGFVNTEKGITANTATLDASIKESTSKLDEVIVTGTSAGTTRKQLGSYVATVKAEDLSKGVPANAIQALQGKTLGAQITQNNGDPAGSISVRLRGISSLTNSEPLYIIDGVIVNNSTTRVTNTQSSYDGTNSVGTIGQNRMVDINPADIERIEVLNGAAAAAIYGSRANSGVIQIFTKRGKSGAPSINFSSSVIFSSLRKKLEVNQSPTKFGGPTDGPGALTQDVLIPNTITTSPVSRYDYQDYIFRPATGTDNNISVSGGTENTKYFFSGSYYNNQGIIKNTDFQRFNFRTNIDQTIAKWLSASIGLNYVNSSANEKPDGNTFYSPMNSVTIIGNFHNIQQRDAFGNIQAVGERGRVNPMSVIEDFTQKNSTSRFISNFSLKFKPIKNLNIDYTMGIDNYSQRGTTFMPPYAYNVASGNFGGGPALLTNENGYASSAASTFFGINHDLNATYTANINKDWTSVTQVGFSQNYEKQDFVMFQGRGILLNSTQTVSSAATVLPGADGRGELSIWGSFIQQNFKYRNHLFITGAIRRDGSSLFSGTQRNQTYAKLSGSYVVSGTDYWKKMKISKWFDQLKIRAAYGESGNLTAISQTDRFNLYGSSSYLATTAYNSLTNSVNPNVGPERQKEFEFGLDLGFLNNRINFTINVYDKKVDGFNFTRTVAPTSGFSSLSDNIGNLQNKGFEMSLSAIPIMQKDFTWSITGLYNVNRNKITNLPLPVITYATNGGAPVALIEGQPVGVFWGTFFQNTPGGNFSKNSIGLVNQDGVVFNSAGIPRTAYGTQNTANLSSVLNPTVVDYLPGGSSGLGTPAAGTAVVRKIIGDPNPTYTATLINEFTYKKLSLRIQIDATKGNSVFNADFRTRQGVGNGVLAGLEQTGKLPRGYISVYTPSATWATGVYGVEQWRVDDGSNVRLRELSLSYNVGKVGKIIKDLSINFAGRNLIVWTNYIGYDPEVNAAGQSTLLRGIDFGSVPIPKTFSFGIQAKF